MPNIASCIVNALQLHNVVYMYGLYGATICKVNLELLIGASSLLAELATCPCLRYRTYSPQIAPAAYLVTVLLSTQNKLNVSN